jgi:hypothetical protein
MFPALRLDFRRCKCHNQGMNGKITVSHNREDYSPRVQMMISAMADVFWNGDLDVAWEDFFKSSERNRAAFENAKSCYDIAEIKLGIQSHS